MELTDKILEAFAMKHGARAKDLLSDAGKRQQFINAMNSPIGQEFIKRLMTRIERNRIVYDTIDIDSSDKKFVEARSRYNESFDVLKDFLDVIEKQEKTLETIRKDMSK